MKTILITGSHGGIGSALVKTFSNHNWHVISASRHAPDQFIDLSNQASLEKFASKLRGQPLDVLVNCAGIYDTKSVDDAAPGANTLSEITPVFKVNTIAPLLLSELLLPNLQLGQDKLVVTISSIMATQTHLDQYSASHWSYGASKAAVNFAMRAFSVSHPDIKSLLIHPGWVKTRMGGPEAPLSPNFSAQHIFNLITNSSKYPTGALIDYTGKTLPE